MGLGEALEELIAAEERLNTVQTAVSRNERLNENLGGSILSKGRALFLSGRYRTASSSMERLWGTAGAKIYGAVDMDEFKGTAVEAVAEILKAIDIRKQEIQDRLLHLITEKTNIDADVEKMPGKGSIRRRMAWVEKALRAAVSSLRKRSEGWERLGWTPERKNPSVRKWKNIVKSGTRSVSGSVCLKARNTPWKPIVSTGKRSSPGRSRVFASRTWMPKRRSCNSNSRKPKRNCRLSIKAAISSKNLYHPFPELWMMLRSLSD